jgi:integrase/recombinase XerD
MVSTGLRVGELVALHVDDVDIQDRSVLVLGKGRKERIVFLTNDWLCDVLSAYIGSRAVRQVSHEYLLFGRDGQPLTTEAVRARIRRAGELTGLSRRITGSSDLSGV